MFFVSGRSPLTLNISVNMLKIDSNILKKIIVSDNLFNGGVVTPIESKFIAEFKIKNKFYYCLINNPELQQTQSKIIEEILSKIELNNSAYAFISGRSYLDFFEPHVGNYNFLRIDIKNFFHSIDVEQLKNMLSHYFKDEFIDTNKKQKLITTLINIVTLKIPSSSKNQEYRGRTILPIGFMTSPVLSNIYMRDFDIKIQDFCTRHDITYSRYADDMLFSSSRESEFIFSETFIKEASILLSLKKLQIKNSKTIKKRHTISLNGYTISNSKFVDGKTITAPEFRISNKKTIILKKFLLLSKKENITAREIMESLFSFKKENYKFLYKPNRIFLESYCRTLLINKITGYRSYLISIIKHGQKYNTIHESTVKKYQSLLLEINNYLEKNPSIDYSKRK